jgi:hypothetical protein
MLTLVLILIVVLLIAALVSITLALLHAHNKPQWNRGQSQLAAQMPDMLTLPPGRRAGDHCCRQDGPCSARCAHLEMAQTITGAVEGVRHGEGLRQIIRLLDYVQPETLREMVEAEAAAPGRLHQIAARLRAGHAGPLGAGGSPDGRGSSAA